MAFDQIRGEPENYDPQQSNKLNRTDAKSEGPILWGSCSSPAQKPEQQTVVPSCDQKQVSILVVDDDETILKTIPRVLTSPALGYDKEKIFVTNSHAKALEILQRQKVDIIISDYDMPEMKYAEFREKALQLAPNTKILLVSGTIADAEDNHAQADGYLMKPFESKQMEKELSDVLSKR